MVDLNADGHKDMLTGCWTKNVFIFRGNAKGNFDVPEPILHRDGSAILPGSASTVFAADWDADGDLDLLLGNIDGEVYLATNEGSRKAYAFGPKQALRAGGQPIKVTGRDSGPCVADWDGDGQADLLVGTGSGDVLLFRNKGTRGKPKLVKARVLVKGSTDGIGTRTKVAVADWNGDGHQDLLVGDFASDRSKYRPPSPGEREAYSRAYQKDTKTFTQWREVLASKKPGATAKAKAERAAKILRLQKRMEEERNEAKKIVGERSNPYRGNVWLFLRKTEDRSGRDAK